MNLFQRLTRLECGENVSFLDLVSALQKCSSLESLTCHLRSPIDTQIDQPFTPSTKVDLPHLKALYVSVSDHEGSYLGSIASQWSMRNLERLCIASYIYKSSTLELLRAHGHHLKFLYVSPRCVFPDTQTVLKCCPSLEHLVLPPSSSCPGFHRTITWVDLWSPPK